MATRKKLLDDNKTTGHILTHAQTRQSRNAIAPPGKRGDLVSTRGFNATGVQEITAAAGVPKGSFYNYFDSKEAFAVAVLTEYWEMVVAEFGAILNQDRTPPLSRVARYFAGLAEFHERRRYAVGCLIGNMALEVTPTSEDVRIKLAAIYREWSAAIASCLREAQDKGNWRPERIQGSLPWR